MVYKQPRIKHDLWFIPSCVFSFKPCTIFLWVTWGRVALRIGAFFFPVWLILMNMYSSRDTGSWNFYSKKTAFFFLIFESSPLMLYEACCIVLFSNVLILPCEELQYYTSLFCRWRNWDAEEETCPRSKSKSVEGLRLDLRSSRFPICCLPLLLETVQSNGICSAQCLQHVRWYHSLPLIL